MAGVKKATGRETLLASASHDANQIAKCVDALREALREERKAVAGMIGEFTAKLKRQNANSALIEALTKETERDGG